MLLNEHLGIEAVIVPQRELFSAFNEEDNTTFKVLACDVLEDNTQQVQLNAFGNIVISGDNLDELSIDVKRKVFLTPSPSKKYKDGYVARIPIDPIPENSIDQWVFLGTIISESEINAFKQVYDNDNYKIIDIINDRNEQMNIVKNVVGYREKRLEKLRTKIAEREEYARTYVLLSKYDMTDNMIQKIYRKYNSEHEIKKIINKNIYQFTEVDGIGFKKIDEIYLNLEDSDKKDINRISSGLHFYLEENQNNGNTRVDRRKLIQGTTTLLDINVKLIRDVLDSKKIVVDKKDINEIGTMLHPENEEYKDKEIVLFNDMYSTRFAFYTEWSLFKTLTFRSNIEPHLVKHDMEDMIKRFEENEGFSLSDEQSQFFVDMYKSSASFLAGNAGSGKTTSQKLMLQYAKETGQSIVFLAPTGRARKKLAEYTGHTAHTIHSFVMSELSDETYNIYFVDESSMIDVVLAMRLLSVVPENSKIVFAGDDSQIPSVSYGNFLYDSLNNKTTFVSRYTRIFRQSEGGILDIVTKIRQGVSFIPNIFRERKVFGKDCVFDLRRPEDGQDISDQAVTAYTNVMKTGDYSVDDVVILSPTKKGKKGTTSVNNKIQEIMNPKSKDKEEFDSMTNGIDVTFREGDLVMNQKNHKGLPTYIQLGYAFTQDGTNISIVNGDIGKIVKIDRSEIFVEFDEGIVQFKKSDFTSGMVIHGWCITGHKSQGSEYKVVICMIDSSSSFQMNGNLLYTMTSRAKELLLVLGDSATINRALKKFENLERETNLKDFFSINDKLMELNGK